MEVWKTTLQSHDVVKYNSRNSYIEVSKLTLNFMKLINKLFKVSLKASKKSNVGNTDMRIDCIVRLFKLVNNRRIYSTEEECTSSICTINDGKDVAQVYIPHENQIFSLIQD